jgi:hypothetical protein
MRRPGDSTPTPPGGHAADRLRMFQEARGQQATPKKANKRRSPASKGAKHAKQDRRKGQGR